MKFDSIALLADDHPPAQAAIEKLKANYDHVPAEEADIIVALGGDGFMLSTVHQHMAKGTPIFGMNLGSIGFLMNEFRDTGLRERLLKSEPIELHALSMKAKTIEGTEHNALAINEVSLLRELRLAAKIKIIIDDVNKANQVIKFIDALEDDDDVQKVYSNFDISEEVMTQLSQ